MTRILPILLALGYWLSAIAPVQAQPLLRNWATTNSFPYFQIWTQGVAMGWGSNVVWDTGSTGYLASGIFHMGANIAPGSSTNALVSTNGVDMGTAGTFNWTYGVTGHLASGVFHLGVSIAGGGKVDELDGVATNLTIHAGSPGLTVVPKIGGNSNSFQVLNTNGQPVIYATSNLTLVASNVLVRGNQTNDGNVLIFGVLTLNSLPGDQALVLDSTSSVVDSPTTAQELTYLSGVTAAIVSDKQKSSMVLSNLVGLASTVFTNVPAGGTNISVRTVGGTNYIDQIVPPESGIHTFTDSVAATNSTANTNITIDMRVKTTRLALTNNATFTNWSGNTATTSGGFALIIQPQLVHRTVVWPSFSTPTLGLYFRTNAGSMLWTTLTNGVEYWLTGDRHDTNVVLTISAFQ